MKGVKKAWMLLFVAPSHEVGIYKRKQESKT